MMKTKRAARWMLAAACLVAGVRAGRGATLAERMPGDAVAFAQWAGADALKGQYAGSNLQGIVDASSLPAVLEKQLTEMTIPGREKKGLSDQEHLLLGAVWKYPGAWSVLPMDGTPVAKGAEMVPRVVYLLDAGADADAVAAAVTGELAELRKDSPEMPEVTVKKYDTVVALVIGKLSAQEEGALSGGKDSLAKTEFFTKGSAEFRKDAAINVLVDGRKVIAAVEDAMAKDAAMADTDKAMAKKVIDVLGVRGLTTLSYSAGFEGKEWAEKTLIGMGKERKGVLTLVDVKPLEEAFLGAIPKDTASVNIWRLDLARAFKEFRAGMAEVDPAAAKDFDQQLKKANAGAGIDIEKDFLAPLGDVMALYRIGSAGDKQASFAFIHPLRDAKTMSETVDTLSTLAGALIKINNEEVAGAKVWTVENPQVPLSVAIAGERLVVCSRLELDDVLGQFKAKTSIVDRPEFAALRKALPQAGIQALDFVDMKAVYGQSEAGIKELAKSAGEQGLDLPEDAVPDVEAIGKFLTPGMSVAWTDEAGYHLEGRCAFPGAGIIGVQQASLAPVAVFGAATAFPSLMNARERANQTAEMANEHGIAQAAIVYSADNADKMPEHLAQLVAGGMISPKSLVTKRSGTQPLVLTPEQQKAAEKDWHTIEKLVDEHCDFVYLGKGTTNTIDSSVILIYTKPSLNLTGGLNATYFDAHSEFLRFGHVEEAFKATNDDRKKQKLPEIKMDEKGLPPSVAP